VVDDVSTSSGVLRCDRFDDVSVQALVD